MTVAAADAKAGPYTGNDVATTFSFAFKIFSAADIRVVETVIATGVETELVLNGANGYTVVKNNDQDNNPGGTITYRQANANAPLPSTKKLTIVGDFDYAQPTDLPNGGPFFANVVENALDRLTMLVKQLREGFNRSLRLSVSDPAGSATEIPPISVRANNLLGFDANGNPVAVAPIAQSATALQALLATSNGAGYIGANDGAGGSVFTTVAGFIARTISSAGASVLGFIQAGVGAVLRNVQDELRETLKPQQFGALGDGATNDATAFTRLKTQAATVKGRVFVPPGTYRLPPGFDLTANDTEWHFAPGAILKLVDAQATTSFITLTAPQNQKIFGMRVDGNRAVQNAALFGPDNCAVLVVDAKNCQFDRIEIISSPAKGLALVSTPGGTTRNTTVSNFVGADCKEQVLIVDGNNITGFFERIVINGVLIGTTSSFGLCLNDGASNVEVSNVISKTGNTISDAVYIRDSFDLQLTNVRGSSARNGVGVERLNGYTGRIQLNNVVGEFNSQNGILLLGAEDVSGGTVTGRNNGTAGINIAQTGAFVRCKRISISNPVGYDDQGVPTQDYGIIVQGVDTCRLGRHTTYGNTVKPLSINRAVSTDVEANTRQIVSGSTGSIASSGQATITLNWPVPFEDASIELESIYLFEATSSTALAISHVIAITTNAVQVQVYNRSGTTAHTATLTVVAQRAP